MDDSYTRRWMFMLGRLEGVSFLLLLGVGVPLKRLANIPEPTAWIGWIHGLLFLLFVTALASASRVEEWPRRRLVWGVISALLPAGTFVFEARVKK